ncbi:DoxX family protein [Qipengyuania sp. DSG2-2]|uniref:DoxX family protein n=1 Tax=Qipengyuania sp. DGS2-2 TaxID=3349631 RepID=UPI0036D31E17
MAPSVTVTIGRVLLGLYFLVPGLSKVAGSADTLAYMQGHGIPFAEPLLWFSAVVNIIGGLFLILGRHVKFVAYGFVVYILLVNVLLHDFWTMEGDIVARETQNFVKNLGILAGLLVLAGSSAARKITPTGWWRSDGAMLRDQA